MAIHKFRVCLKFYGFFAAACALQPVGSLFYNDSSNVDFSLVLLTQNDKGFVIITCFVILSASEVFIQNTGNGMLNFQKT